METPQVKKWPEYKRRQRRGLTVINERAIMTFHTNRTIELNDTEEAKITHLISQIHECVDKMLMLRGSLVTESIVGQTARIMMMHRRVIPITTVLRRIASYDLAGITKVFPYFNFHPHVSIFIDEALTTPALARSVEEVHFSLQHAQGYAIAILNRFVAAITAQIRSAPFKLRLEKWYRAAQKDSLSMSRHISKIVNTDRPVSIMRMELRYRKACETFQGDEEIKPKVTQSHRRNLLNCLRRKPIAATLLGYVWKLEHSSETGFRYQLLLLIDGSMDSLGQEIANTIERTWNDITETRGAFFVYGYKNRPEECRFTLPIPADQVERSAIYEKFFQELTDTLYHLSFDRYFRIRAIGRSECKKKSVRK